MRPDASFWYCPMRPDDSFWYCQRSLQVECLTSSLRSLKATRFYGDKFWPLPITELALLVRRES